MKYLVTGLLVGASAWALAQTSPIEIFHRKGEQGRYEYFARNNQLCPYQVYVEFDVLKNLKASEEVPFFRVVYPNPDPQLLFSLEADKNASATSFSSKYSLAKGDPNAEIDEDHAYWLPYESGETLEVLQGYNGAYSHQGNYALDFALAAGTKVYASRAGTVIEVKEDSNLGGPNESFKADGNYITIYHADGSFADYYHLKYQGAKVAMGDEVTAGQVIGYSGETGWADGAHLHFQVYKASRLGIQTLPTLFLQKNGTAISLKENERYQSYHDN